VLEKDRRRSFESIVSEIEKYYIESRRNGIAYMQ
jgi:hypothetical protein